MTEPRNPIDYLPPVETLRGAELRLLSLFTEILHHHGIEKTRKMFENYCRLPTAIEQGNYEKLELLKRLDGMKPRPNVKKLARELVAESGIPPNDPNFQGKFEAQDKYIRRLKKNRPNVEAKFGNVSPRLARDEPAGFVIVERKKTDIS